MVGDLLYVFEPWQMCLIFFAGIIFFAYLGFKAGKISRKNNEAENRGFSTTRNGIITLLSLLLGFTFSMSGERYRSYKKVFMDEVNCIQTARLNSDLYPEPYRSEFKKDFLDYIEARISFFEAGIDLVKINESKRKSDIAGKKLREISSHMFQDKETLEPSKLMVASLNAMFNSAITREENLKSKVPSEIPSMIFLITFIAVFLTGFGINHFHTSEKMFLIAFAVVITLVTYIIFDLDRPDTGLAKPTVEQNAMIELRDNLINEK
jgi:hypothetical protein